MNHGTRQPPRQFARRLHERVGTYPASSGGVRMQGWRIEGSVSLVCSDVLVALVAISTLTRTGLLRGGRGLRCAARLPAEDLFERPNRGARRLHCHPRPLDGVWSRFAWRRTVRTGQLNGVGAGEGLPCLLYTSPSPRDRTRSRMPSSA